MRVRHIAGAVGALCILAICGYVATDGLRDEEREPRRAKIAESNLRKAAIKMVRPVYPSEALARGSTGTAVAAVTIGVDGIPEEVDVVESPSPDIAEAVRMSVLQWRFTPVEVADTGELLRGMGTLTFYFRISNGQGQVKYPEEMLREQARNSQREGQGADVVIDDRSAR